jgi:hypothetical protein
MKPLGEWYLVLVVTLLAGECIALCSCFQEWEQVDPRDSWIAQDSCRTLHPLDPSQQIYIWHCMTHLQKSMRNALYNSGTRNGSRQFKDLNDVPFGCATINALFVNDQCFLRKKTAVSDDSVKLSGWSKMNVSLSKAPFEDKALAELY